MRGAVALALALHMEVESSATKRVILTSTLFIILFTIVFMGGSALPLIKILSDIYPDEPSSKLVKQQRRRTRRARSKANGGMVNGTVNAIAAGPSSAGPSSTGKTPVILSKTQEMVIFDNSEHFTECEENATDPNAKKRPPMPERKNIFTAINENFVRPFFVRKFTPQEKLENNKKLRHIAFEAMKHEGGPTPVGAHGAPVGGGGTSGPNESSSDEEVFFQSSTTLNASNGGEPVQPLLPL